MSEIELKDICYECGDDVTLGSGKYANRIPNLNDYLEMLEMNVPYPKGKWLCAECDERIQDENIDKIEYQK